MSDSDLMFDRAISRKPDELSRFFREPEAEEIDDHGAFGWLRGVRDRAIMLELRKKNGNSKAFNLAWLKDVELDPSIGILLDFSGQKVKILGRNLNIETRPNVRLYAGILRCRVPWIQEADDVRIMRTQERELLIERIEW